MIFAAFGDINGNFSVCNAVLDWLAGEGIHAAFHTGNLLLGGTQGDVLLHALDGRGVVFVQGERDRVLARYERKQGSMDARLDAATRDEILRTLPGISSANLERLRTTPHMLHTTLEGTTICTCHGSPSSQRKTLTEDTPEVRFAREREIANAHIVLLGGSPAPFHRWVAGTLFVAPGVCARGGNTAHFTLVNTEVTPWTVGEVAVPL